MEEWSKSEQMARERENFGFYFAAHPVEQWRAVASANGARSYAGLMETGVPGGGRAPAVMAAMVEGVQRRKTRRGADFVVAEFSDNSGQFSASCFEESLVEPMLQWAKDGTCLLLQVELDAPSPDEPPRVTVRSARPLSEVKSAGSMVLKLDVLTTDALVGWLQALGPLFALALIYGATLLLTEILSNAAVAVLLTPMAVALAESLGVSPRPFLVAVMMAASAAFATPFGYQTNVLVFQMGGYSYMDFVRVGVPLNIVTWIAAMIAIPVFFPF